MKRLITFLLFATLTASAQQSVSVYAIGDLNPTNFITLHSQRDRLIVNSNASKSGGGAEYQRFFGQHFGVGLSYYQNPSDGKLFVYTSNGPNPNEQVLSGIWPMMRYETDVELTARFPEWRRITAFMQGGLGIVVTDGPTNSGWSANFGPVGGYGFDYAVSKHWAWRAKTSLELMREGCYGDHTCTAAPAVTQIVATGPVFSW